MSYNRIARDLRERIIATRDDMPSEVTSAEVATAVLDGADPDTEHAWLALLPAHVTNVLGERRRASMAVRDDDDLSPRDVTPPLADPGPVDERPEPDATDDIDLAEDHDEPDAPAAHRSRCPGGGKGDHGALG